MIPGRKYTPEYLLRLAWRHRWLIVVPFALVATTTVLVADRLPNLFRSETLILVIPQRIPTEYVRSTVTALIEDRLQTISQQILSRTRLETIIDDMNLYTAERLELPMEDVVQGMRGRIQVEIVEGDAFTIAYEAEDARTSMLVTQRLASLFITENLRDREVLASGTSSFLESQLETARQRLVDHEQRLEDYQLRHTGQLPSQLATNLQVIQGIQFQLQSLADTLNRDRDRLLLVERLVSDVSSEEAAMDRIPDEADLTGNAPAPVRLLAARRYLRNLELRFMGDHPQVARTKRLIEDLEAEVSLQQETDPSASGEGPEDAWINSQADAVMQSRLRELQSERELLERQIAYSTAEHERLLAEQSAYQSRVDSVPAREAELVGLTRDYNTLQSIYETLLAKREDSKIAENLERRQIGEQFKVLDPAVLPERPIRPDRIMINLGGAVGGLMLGFGLLGFLEYRDEQLKTETDVTGALSLPVLTVIPALVSLAQRRRTQVVGWAVSAAGSVIVVACLGVVLRTLL